MRLLFIRFVAILTLTAFGWIQAESVVHAWLHADDQHCTDSEKHYHEKEHHCFACDMTVHAAIDHQPQTFVAQTFSAFILIHQPLTEAEIKYSTLPPSLRGPPVFF